MHVPAQLSHLFSERLHAVRRRPRWGPLVRLRWSLLGHRFHSPNRQAGRLAPLHPIDNQDRRRTSHISRCRGAVPARTVSDTTGSPHIRPLSEELRRQKRRRVRGPLRVRARPRKPPRGCADLARKLIGSERAVRAPRALGVSLLRRIVSAATPGWVALRARAVGWAWASATARRPSTAASFATLRHGTSGALARAARGYVGEKRLRDPSAIRARTLARTTQASLLRVLAAVSAVDRSTRDREIVVA